MIRPESSQAILFVVACVVTGATLFGMGAIKVRHACVLRTCLRTLRDRSTYNHCESLLGVNRHVSSSYRLAFRFAVFLFVLRFPCDKGTANFCHVSSHVRKRHVNDVHFPKQNFRSSVACSVVPQSQFGTRHWCTSGTEMLFLGGSCAALAFEIGKAVDGLIGQNHDLP